MFFFFKFTVTPKRSFFLSSLFLLFESERERDREGLVGYFSSSLRRFLLFLRLLRLPPRSLNDKNARVLFCSAQRDRETEREAERARCRPLLLPPLLRRSRRGEKTTSSLLPLPSGSRPPDQSFLPPPPLMNGPCSLPTKPRKSARKVRASFVRRGRKKRKLFVSFEVAKKRFCLFFVLASLSLSQIGRAHV